MFGIRPNLAFRGNYGLFRFQIARNFVSESSSRERTNRFASQFEKRQIEKHPGEKRQGEKRQGEKRKHANFQKNDSRRRSEPIRAPRKIRFEFNSGLDQAQNALKNAITRVHALSENYRVSFVDPETNKIEQKHLVDIVNALDLTRNGILVVPQPGKVPLIKLNKTADMLKTYTDQLAQQREKELLELGSSAAQRAVRQRERLERKKSSTKILALSWHISVSDLLNQKKSEISKRLDKDGKFVIYVGEKKSLYSARMSVNKEDGLIATLKNEEMEDDVERQPFEGLLPVDLNNADEDINIELRRRHMIYQKLEEILQENEAQYQVSGSVDSRIMLSVSARPNRAAEQTEQKQLSAKELRKQQKRQQKQDNPAADRKKVDDEDLDSLYLFKIEE